EKRLQENRTYQLIQESAQWKENLNKEETISLNQKKFNEIMQLRKAQIKQFKGLDKFDNGLKFTLNSDEAAREKTDEAFNKKTQTWLKNLQRDLYLREAIHVISEMK